MMMKNCVDPDQLAHQNPADLDLHIYQRWSEVNCTVQFNRAIITVY